MTNEREQALRLAREAGFEVDAIYPEAPEFDVDACIRLISLAQEEVLDKVEAATQEKYLAQCKYAADWMRKAEAAEKRISELDAQHNATYERAHMLEHQLRDARDDNIKLVMDLATATALLREFRDRTDDAGLREDADAFLSEGK